MKLLLNLKNGHLDAAIAATPLEDEKIKEIVLYFEPFVAYIPEHHRNFQKEEIEVSDLNSMKFYFYKMDIVLEMEF